MIFLEIVMVVIGMAAVIYSFRVADTSESENETTSKTMHVIDMDTTEQMEQQLQDYQQKVENIAADTELQTEDKLRSLSNESILGISEYSDQVLDKIEKNHADVVFLYNMLNEKQDELKEIINDSDKMKAELRDELSRLYQEHQEWAQITKEELEEMTERCKDAITESYEMAEPEEILSEDLESEMDEILHAEDDLPEESAALPQVSPEEPEEPEGFQKQAEILDLYKKGHSVLEISKLLSIGQGEVGFVIGLYG
ncbi:MAG: hypothetical protein K2J67_07620 [Lachnospiraceae bacterium]|nr:hypothetical protein [Lachnospiraceae bacterium]